MSADGGQGQGETEGVRRNNQRDGDKPVQGRTTRQVRQQCTDGKHEGCAHGQAGMGHAPGVDDVRGSLALDGTGIGAAAEQAEQRVEESQSDEPPSTQILSG